jgi:hypothetical protein
MALEAWAKRECWRKAQATPVLEIFEHCGVHGRAGAPLA